MKGNRDLVVVVGGLGLIGKAIVKKVLESGLRPFVVDSRPRPADADVSPGMFFKADLSKKGSEEALWKRLNPLQGELSGWINAAYPRTRAYGSYSYLDDAKGDGMENLVLHAGAFYRSCRTAVRLMEGSGGNIVNLGSIYGPLGPDMRIYEGTSIKNAAAYAMIKGGILGLTRYVATAFADKKIRCNALCPGGVFDGQSGSFVKKYSNRVPLGRMARAEEVASAALFLVSGQSSYVTGQALMVDGGLSAW